MSDRLYGFIENCKDAGFDFFFNDIPNKIGKIASWIGRNPEKAAAYAGIAISILRASQSIVVSQRVRNEQLRQDYRYYDPSNHIHWDLCRKLSNYDKTEILRRRKNGEDVYDILKDLRAVR